MSRPLSRLTMSISTIAIVALLVYVGSVISWRHAALFAVGVAAGLILYHAAFGFTAAWREVVVSGRGAGLRAQMIMVGVAVLIFVPLIAEGEVWGTALRGNVYPLNVAVIVGAFLFGIGMQLGGSCASGTLFTVGGGNTRMLLTLVMFIAGSVIGAWHWTAWQDSAGLAPVSLSASYGTTAAIGISLGIVALIWVVSVIHERRRHGSIRSDRVALGGYSLLRGPWPLIIGGLGLCAVNVATLLLAGRPWGITSGFALWGSKLAAIGGLDVASWEYWQRPAYAASLNDSVFVHITSVMNFGIILGALLAASIAAKFAPSWKISFRSALAAVIGGLLMGYGARIAFGCNIGAFFSGAASASLSGWLWFVAAFVGSIVGIQLRPSFGMK